MKLKDMLRMHKELWMMFPVDIDRKIDFSIIVADKNGLNDRPKNGCFACQYVIEKYPERTWASYLDLDNYIGYFPNCEDMCPINWGGDGICQDNLPESVFEKWEELVGYNHLIQSEVENSENQDYVELRKLCKQIANLPLKLWAKIELNEEDNV